MDLLDRLHRRLLAAVPTPLSRPFGSPELTVADLYQRIIPYRLVRGEFGAMELAEYEHALLRLLSGERRYLEVVDAAVRGEIQRELTSPNPILGIYRDYAAATVRFVDRGESKALPDRSPTGPEAPSVSVSPRSGTRVPTPERSVGQTHSPPTSPEEGSPVRTATIRDSRADGSRHRTDSPEGTVPRTFASPAPPAAPVPVQSPTGQIAGAPKPVARTGMAKESAPLNSLPVAPAITIAGSRGPTACRACLRSLPEVDDLVYCPYCGELQAPVPCPRCGTVLEGAWSFCIRCGAARAETASG